MLRFKIKYLNNQFYLTKIVKDLMGDVISSDMINVPYNDIYHTYSESQLEFLYNQYCDKFEKKQFQTSNLCDILKKE